MPSFDAKTAVTTARDHYLQNALKYGAIALPVAIFFSYRLNVEYFAHFGLPASYLSFSDLHLLLRGIDHLIFDQIVIASVVVAYFCVAGHDRGFLLAVAGQRFRMAPVFVLFAIGCLFVVNWRVSQISKELYIRDVFLSTTRLGVLRCTAGNNADVHGFLLHANSGGRPALILRMAEERIITFLAPPIELGTPSVELVHLKVGDENIIRTSSEASVLSASGDFTSERCIR